jgi:SSS family solute:Na+ symporter
LFIIWMIFNGLVCAVGWAPEASRALPSKDPETTRRTFLVAVPGQFARLGIPALIAIAAFCYFVRIPELSAHFFPNGAAETSPHAAQALPLFLAKVVPTGFLGLLMAGLLAAFMSTHDSYFLCWSSIIVRDVVGPLRIQTMDDRCQIRLTRISIVIMGVFLLVWGVWYPLPESVWTYMAVTGNVYLCGAGIVLVVGIYWKRASSTGAFLTILGGLISLIALVT